MRVQTFLSHSHLVICYSVQGKFVCTTIRTKLCSTRKVPLFAFNVSSFIRLQNIVIEEKEKRTQKQRAKLNKIVSLSAIATSLNLMHLMFPDETYKNKCIYLTCECLLYPVNLDRNLPDEIAVKIASLNCLQEILHVNYV